MKKKKETKLMAWIEVNDGQRSLAFVLPLHSSLPFYFRNSAEPRTDVNKGNDFTFLFSELRYSLLQFNSRKNRGTQREFSVKYMFGEANIA